MIMEEYNNDKHIRGSYVHLYVPNNSTDYNSCECSSLGVYTMSLCLPGILSLFEGNTGWYVDDGTYDSEPLTSEYLDEIITEHEEAVRNLKHFKETQRL